MDETELRRRVEGIRWFHSMELAPGISTRGAQGAPRNGTAETLKRLGLPPSFAGKTVLDVGAWDGFFSFEAERRGAARVLATDHFSWSGGGWGTQDGFLLAREALGSKVEDLHIDPLDLSVERVGTFDVVFLFGVLYHVKNPLLVLERVAAVCKELFIVETYVDQRMGEDYPAMVYYPGSELSDDPTNWWGPNARCVEAMLGTVGFPKVETVWGDPDKPTLTSRRDKIGRMLRPGKKGTRVAFHARP
jgi:tRNA (mo5U34)-methyltransferase